MAFIEIRDGKLLIDDTDWQEKSLLKNLELLVAKEGFDELQVSTGVHPSPNFGYFELADRFWRASLCIYFTGVSRGFWESGAGFVEPWLFNACHAIELYLKGFLQSADWLEDVQQDLLCSGHKVKVENLKKRHDMETLYAEYTEKIKEIVSKWNREKLSEPPEIEKMLLAERGEVILNEIIEANENSFRFRYPSLRQKEQAKQKAEELQIIAWDRDDKALFPITGIARKAGYFFDHVKVINTLHELNKEMREIASYHNACWDYIGAFQDIAKDLMRQYENY